MRFKLIEKCHIYFIQAICFFSSIPKFDIYYYRLQVAKNTIIRNTVISHYSEYHNDMNIHFFYLLFLLNGLQLRMNSR